MFSRYYFAETYFSRRYYPSGRLRSQSARGRLRRRAKRLTRLFGPQRSQIDRERAGRIVAAEVESFVADGRAWLASAKAELATLNAKSSAAAKLVKEMKETDAANKRAIRRLARLRQDENDAMAIILIS